MRKKTTTKIQCCYCRTENLMFTHCVCVCVSCTNTKDKTLKFSSRSQNAQYSYWPTCPGQTLVYLHKRQTPRCWTQGGSKALWAPDFRKYELLPLILRGGNVLCRDVQSWRVHPLDQILDSPHTQAIRLWCLHPSADFDVFVFKANVTSELKLLFGVGDPTFLAKFSAISTLCTTVTPAHVCQKCATLALWMVNLASDALLRAPCIRKQIETPVRSNWTAPSELSCRNMSYKCQTWWVHRIGDEQQQQKSWSGCVAESNTWKSHVAFQLGAADLSEFEVWFATNSLTDRKQNGPGEMDQWTVPKITINLIPSAT